MNYDLPREFLLNHSTTLQFMTDEDAGKLIHAILAAVWGGEPPEFEDDYSALGLAYKLIFNALDRLK